MSHVTGTFCVLLLKCSLKCRSFTCNKVFVAVILVLYWLRESIWILLLPLLYNYYIFFTHPNIQSPVNGSQSPAQSHGRQPYSWKPQYPTMHLSQWAPPTPGLQMQFPLVGSQSAPSAKWKGMEPMGWQLHARKEKLMWLIKMYLLALYYK